MIYVRDMWVFTVKGIYINNLLAKYCLIWILFVLLLELVVLVFSLVNPVKEGELASKGVVQLLPREHVLHHLSKKNSRQHLMQIFKKENKCKIKAHLPQTVAFWKVIINKVDLNRCTLNKTNWHKFYSRNQSFDIIIQWGFERLPSSRSLICFQWSSAMWIQHHTATNEKSYCRIYQIRNWHMRKSSSIQLSIHGCIYWPFPTVPPRGQKLLVANRQRQSGRQLSAETHQSWFHSCGSSSSVWSPIMILFLRIFFFVVDTHHDLILADAHLIMYWNLNYLLSREDPPCDSNGLSRLYVCVVDQTRLVHHLSYQVGLHSIHLWILNTKQK